MVLGNRRTPVDAEGQFAASRMKRSGPPDPEELAPFQSNGKVVLQGKEVLRIPDDSDDEDPRGNGYYDSDGRDTDTDLDYQSDDRDEAEESDRAHEIIDLTDTEEGSVGPVSKAEENESSGWFSWFTTGKSTKQTVEPSESMEDYAEEAKPITTEAPPSAKSSGWSLFSWSTKKEEDNEDDDSVADGSTSNLFGELSSLPSVNGDVTIDGASLTSTDFGARDDRSAMGRESVFERKLKEISVPPPRKEIEEPASKKNSSSLSHKRQVLVKELRHAIATHGRFDVKCADISSKLGNVLDEAEEYEQAIKLHKDAVTIYSVKLGDHHPKTNEAKIGLASVLTNAGEYDEALANYYVVTAMQRSLKGEQDTSIADGLALMAHCLRRNGEFQQAIKELKRALKIYRETLGDSHEKVSTTVDAIASLYVTVGDFEKSAAILEEVVKLKAATMGMKTKEVAETLSSLAMTYECSEQFTQAMKSLKKAYKIYTEIGGYSSEDATATLNKIALLYEATGDFNRASIAYLGVLRGRKILYGEGHLLVGEIYCKLGRALRETGQLEKALKCMKEALPIFVGMGVEMNDVEKIAEIMHEMALIYKDKRHYNEASRILKQELSVRRKIGQPEFPHIARTLNHLGVVEYEMHNNSRALRYLVEALTIFQEQGEHGMDCAEVLFNTGLVFSAVKNRDRALEAFNEAERLFSKHGCKENHPYRINTKREIMKVRSNGRFK